CGSELLATASCTCTRDGRISSHHLTDSPANRSPRFLRIVKGTCGSERLKDWIAFEISPSLGSLESKVCLRSTLSRSLQQGMEAFGLAQSVVSADGKMGNLLSTAKATGCPMKTRILYLRTVAEGSGSRRLAALPALKMADSLPYA